MKITPETAPVGARLLVSRFTQLSEITVLEWSPSGRRIKYRPATNPKAEVWSEEMPQWYELVERLPEASDGTGVGLSGPDPARLQAGFERALAELQPQLDAIERSRTLSAEDYNIEIKGQD